MPSHPPMAAAQLASRAIALAMLWLPGCLANSGLTHPSLRPPAVSPQEPTPCRASHTAWLFWSPSCESCKPWLATADRLWRRQATTLHLIGVAVDGSPAEVRTALADYRIAFPQAMDEEGTLRARAGTTTIPALVVLDRCEAVTRRSHEGSGPEELERMLIEAADDR